MGSPPGPGSDSFQQAFIQAQRLHQARKLRPAARAYRDLLERFKDLQPEQQAQVYHLLGLVHSQAEQHQWALEALEQAVQLAPEDASIQHNLGEALRRAGEPERAEEAFRQALALQPGFAEAHFNLGNLLKTQERLDEACEHYRQAAQLKPDYAAAWYNLGNSLLALGRFRSASECLRTAIGLEPKHALAHNNLGIALQELDELPEAVESFRRAIDLQPGLLEAQRNLAQALEKRGDLDGAQHVYQSISGAYPDDPAFRLHVETLCPAIMASNGAIDEYHARLRAALERCQGLTFTPQQLSRANLTPPSLIIYHGLNDLPLRRRWADLVAPAFSPAGKRPKPARRAPVLHIGFVVTHGHEGVFLKCMRGMLNRLDGERFRITVACSRQAGEQILRLGVANPAVDYLALPSDLEAAAGLVRQADFDILHYWEVGTDVLNYFLPFYGLAPVQCATWGWPVTSGIPQVDYFLSCELLEGEHSQRLYSERLVQFKRLPTYYYRPPVPAEMQPRSRFGLGAHDHLYLCSQNLRKVHPDFDRLALEILRADPKGRVLFIQDAQPGVTELLRQRLQNTLEETSGRVQFLPRLPEADYLNLLGVVDVALDTVHYCGGANTCYDAFAMGTPVVTLPMHYQRGRYTAAAYRQMGLPDLIAYSARDYVNLALRLACEPDFRRHYSDEIRSRCEALFEDQGAVDELSQFFEEAYA